VPSKKIQSQATKTRETLRADSLSKAIDAVGQAEFLPRLLDYLRIDVPFVGILLLLLDEHNRPFHIYDTIRTPYRIAFINSTRSTRIFANTGKPARC
jgi:hypothetical protein